jgi:glycosyltransferase involved in cell wall biosynthesis
VVSDAEEMAAFHSATIVWTFYPGNYGPSGVFVRAGQAAKPVVCTKEGYCGRVVREVGMGIAVDERDSAGLVDALLYLIENPRARAAMGEAGCAYFSKSSPTAFADPIVAAIARRCAPA